METRNTPVLRAIIEVRASTLDDVAYAFIELKNPFPGLTLRASPSF